MAKKKTDTLEQQTARIPTSTLKLAIEELRKQLLVATSPEAVVAIQERIDFYQLELAQRAADNKE